MITWEGEGLLLSVRRHGEANAIIDVFTETQGRHAGIVRGGAGRKLAPVLQPGATLSLAWQARLEDHLGTFRVEPVTSRAALMADRACLATLTAICALIRETLPERAPVPGLYARTLEVLDAMPSGAWMEGYARWELMLLQELGFGLDLSRCAVTGAADGLEFVSPKSGRAVSRTGAGEWVDRLLPLPAFLRLDVAAEGGDIEAALALTGYFLREHVAREVYAARLADPRDAAARAIARKLHA
ncbi:MAG: DNA repair protein RecO [Pseudomonadota bacterium]